MFTMYANCTTLSLLLCAQHSFCLSFSLLTMCVQLSCSLLAARSFCLFVAVCCVCLNVHRVCELRCPVIAMRPVLALLARVNSAISAAHLALEHVPLFACWFA